ncbi:hypothetical protein M758_9G042200 [Ceratodon purpureus]|uniref:DUF7733 domain-containing protein n=1 Tax=Ceratodon purpureus TaxID=3225 RepID=A0A8T0GU00_CERPU|nr:hypothetical protein KC19_9G041500 [Ceratodon purpureus]KAG0605234.1 hypothetical protein M758_9G042200 [Ceratodon purpureus]
MSGATLATGPRIPKHVDRETHGEKFDRRAPDSGGLGGIMGSLRVIELQLVAFIIVFSASGLVPIVDLAFPVFLTVYSFLLSGLVFPNYGNPESLQVFKGNRLFQVYVVVGTVIGLFLPLAYVLGGFARNDQEAVRAATPHLFLLSFQVLSENLIAGLNIFSVPVRALLPILYSTRRLFSLSDWVVNTWVVKKIGVEVALQDETWIWFGRVLSAANAIYYTINLFVFLIPMFLPRAFETYFEDRANFHKEHPKQEKSYMPSLPGKIPVPSLLKKDDPTKEKKAE